jgi:hypothetical protein
MRVLTVSHACSLEGDGELNGKLFMFIDFMIVIITIFQDFWSSQPSSSSSSSSSQLSQLPHSQIITRYLILLFKKLLIIACILHTHLRYP